MQLCNIYHTLCVYHNLQWFIMFIHFISFFLVITVSQFLSFITTPACTPCNSLVWYTTLLPYSPLVGPEEGHHPSWSLLGQTVLFGQPFLPVMPHPVHHLAPSLTISWPWERLPSNPLPCQWGLDCSPASLYLWWPSLIGLHRLYPFLYSLFIAMPPLPLPFSSPRRWRQLRPPKHWYHYMVS